MWSRNTVRERVRTYLSSVAGILCGDSRRTHTRELTGLLEWPAGISLGPRLQTLYCFSTPTRKYEHASSPTYFLFMTGYRNLYTSVFFLVICWSYLRTEISVTLSTSNNSIPRHPPLFFSLSCETTLLMLSCDRIESAKFLQGTQTCVKEGTLVV